MADGTLKVGTITNSAGSGNIAIGSGVTINVNRPAFCFTKASDQTISLNTTTIVTLDSQIVDTNSAFSSNAFTVPSGLDGNYLIGFQCAFRNSAAFYKYEFSVFKNGSEDQPSLKKNFASSVMESNYTNREHSSAIRPLVAGDVLDLRALIQAGSGTAQIMTSSTLFYGFKIGA